MEEQLTLDELFLTYEATTERQTRLMKAVAAAWGASGEEESSFERPGTITDKHGNQISLFGYAKVDKID